MNGSKINKPKHPGIILREDILPALKITPAEFAKRLKVSTRILSAVLQEQRPLTVDMAIRLSRLFGNTPQEWLNSQVACDIWQLERQNAYIYEEIERIGS